MLRVSQLALRLSLSASKIYLMVSRKEIPHHRIGGAIRFTEEDVLSILQMTKRERGTISTTRKPPRPRLKHIQL